MLKYGTSWDFESWYRANFLRSNIDLGNSILLIDEVDALLVDEGPNKTMVINDKLGT